MIFNTLTVNEDTAWLMIDSTIIRMLLMQEKNVEQEQELEGGFSSKLHAACDALGNHH